MSPNCHEMEYLAVLNNSLERTTKVRTARSTTVPTGTVYPVLLYFV